MGQGGALFEPLVLEGSDYEMELLPEGLVDPMGLVARVDLLRGLGQAEGTCALVRGLGILEELAELLVCSNEESLILFEACCDGDIHLCKQELDPGC